MKFMNLKRFASTALAGVMALSLAAPAFAASQPANSTVVTGTYTEIPISVTVPTTGTAQINPFGLPVSVAKPSGKTAEIIGQKITTQPLFLKNTGASSMNVKASLTVKPTGETNIVASSSLGTAKNAAVKLQVVGLDKETLSLAEDDKLNDLLIDEFVKSENWDGAKEVEAKPAASGTNGTAADSTGNLAVVGAAVMKSGEFSKYGSNSIAMFRLTGDVVQAPKKGTSPNETSDPWKSTDGFTATIVFTFEPQVPFSIVTTGMDTEEVLNLDLPSSAVEGATVTFTFTPKTGVTFEDGNAKLTELEKTGSPAAYPTIAGTSVTLEKQSDGTYKGSFVMPGQDCRLSIVSD